MTEVLRTPSPFDTHKPPKLQELPKRQIAISGVFSKFVVPASSLSHAFHLSPPHAPPPKTPEGSTPTSEPGRRIFDRGFILLIRTPIRADVEGPAAAEDLSIVAIAVANSWAEIREQFRHLTDALGSAQPMPPEKYQDLMHAMQKDPSAHALAQWVVAMMYRHESLSTTGVGDTAVLGQ